MSLFKWIEVPPLGDQRGSLVSLESNKTIPFDIKRVYYIFHTKAGVTRGMHAHKNLKQVMLCITGSCEILLDNGKKRQTNYLNSATKGIFLHGLIWREMSNFSLDCVLLVLASDYYNELDYIRNYKEFKRVCSS